MGTARRIATALPAVLLVGIGFWQGLRGETWAPGAVAAAVVAGVLFLFFWTFEVGRTNSREVAVIAALAAVAAVLRLPFAGIPGLQPTTMLVAVSGLAFGWRAGCAVGATAALVSNFFLGQGPWTPWQMLAWGLVGATAGPFGRATGAGPGRLWMAGFLFGWGYLYGAVMNLWFWLTFISPLTWGSFAAVEAASFWFDTLHAAGNVLFYLLAGPDLVRVLRRFRKRMTFSVE